MSYVYKKEEDEEGGMEEREQTATDGSISSPESSERMIEFDSADEQEHLLSPREE